jgi:hypothetical protein
VLNAVAGLMRPEALECELLSNILNPIFRL